MEQNKKLPLEVNNVLQNAAKIIDSIKTRDETATYFQIFVRIRCGSQLHNFIVKSKSEMIVKRRKFEKIVSIKGRNQNFFLPNQNVIFFECEDFF